jgi:hypothetical protein
MTRNEAIIFLMKALSDAVDLRIPIGSSPDWWERQSRATMQARRALSAVGVTPAETDALVHDAFPVADPEKAVDTAIKLGVPFEDIRRAFGGDDK